MAQWIYLHRNNIFVNRTRLPLLCEKSGAILLVLASGLAGWLAGRQAGSQMKYGKRILWRFMKMLTSRFRSDLPSL